MSYGVPIQTLSRATNTGVVTVNTREPHTFNVGDKINIFGVLGGGTVAFDAGQPFTVTSVTGVSYVGSAISGYSVFTYTQSAASGVSGSDGLAAIAISSGSALSNQVARITLSQPHNLRNSKWLAITGVTQSSGTALTNLINTSFGKDNARIVSSTVIDITLAQPVNDWSPGGTALNWAAGSVIVRELTAVAALDDGINTRTGDVGGAGVNNGWAPLPRVRAEGTAIMGVLKLVAASKGFDYPFRRLFDPSDVSLVSASSVKTTISVNQAPTTFRSVLDSLVETYSGVDAKKRRYWITPDGILAYKILDDTKPATANAPYKIVTSTPGTPNAVGAISSVTPYALTVMWDHDTTKRALFSMSRSQGAPINDLIKFDSADALGTMYSRPGAPYFDDAISYPTGTDDKVLSRQIAARSYFLERSAPILSGSFELRGAGTASHNSNGFSSGYASVSSPVSYTLPAYVGSRVSGTVTVQTAYLHNFQAGMVAVITGFGLSSGPGTAYSAFNGTATITAVGSNGTAFSFAQAGADLIWGKIYASNDETVTAYGSFVRTGTAPNQIVTVTLPQPHGIASGATTTIANLTGTAGSTMNGTVTPTVVDAFTFTYPSTGTNGTATGTQSATVSSLTLVPRWEPGMYVDIENAAMNLSGLYRVEQVDWRFEDSSYTQIITITFNRKNTKLLSRIARSMK